MFTVFTVPCFHFLGVASGNYAFLTSNVGNTFPSAKIMSNATCAVQTTTDSQTTTSIPLTTSVPQTTGVTSHTIRLNMFEAAFDLLSLILDTSQLNAVISHGCFCSRFDVFNTDDYLWEVFNVLYRSVYSAFLRKFQKKITACYSLLQALVSNFYTLKTYLFIWCLTYRRS